MVINWKNVSLGEAHGMTINCEAKDAMTAQTTELFHIKAHHLPYRTKLLKNPLFIIYVVKRNQPGHIISVSKNTVRWLLEFIQIEQCPIKHTAN